MFSQLRKAAAKAASWLDYTACIMISLLCAWVTVDVIGRTFFGKPIPGTAELASNSIVAILFLEIPLVEARKKNLRSDILLEKFSQRGKGAVELISTFFGLIVFGCGSYFCFRGMLLSWSIREYDGEGSLHIPTYLFKTVVVIGCILMMFILLFNLYDAVMMIVGKSEKPEGLEKGEDV